MKIIGLPYRILYHENNTKMFVNASYFSMIEYFNCQAVILTTNTFSICDGFIIPGGYDIDSKYYDEENIHCENISEQLDLLDKEIIEYAFNNEIPLLGICRGMQGINVFLGGSLYQDIPNHQNTTHLANSLFFNKKEKVMINSYHHQSIKKLGCDLVPFIKSVDNTIEGVYHKTKPIIGLQWHPEKEMNDFDKRVLSKWFSYL